MAREWLSDHGSTAQPAVVTSHPMERSDLTGLNPGPDGWPARRGTVLWQGHADLTGGFPGFAAWGCQAESVRVTLTDHFLLVDEGAPHGFGLPIGWLGAAQVLTGVEPIAMETADRFRVCYASQHGVRGFVLRVRGGRIAGRAGRRAARLRSAAASLGLVATAPSTEFLLPPEHDLSLDWDAFTAFEHEPVSWSGRAIMPVGSGLASATCDVWLTAGSLIWGARSRAGIYRIAMADVTGLTAVTGPGWHPTLYWSIAGHRQTRVDLRMAIPGGDGAGETAWAALLDALTTAGQRIDDPVSPPQPWSAPIESAWPAIAPVRARTAPTVIPVVPVSHSSVPERVEDVSLRSAVADTASTPPAVGMGAAVDGDETDETLPRPERITSSPRRVMDEHLFPDQRTPRRPISTPLPWGERVEAVEDGATPPFAGPVAGPRFPTDRPIMDRLRIWPPVSTRRAERRGSEDGSAMLVRRPRIEITTEEFLAAEQASRDAERAAASAAPATVEDTVERRTDRGVLIRFRHPERDRDAPRAEVSRVAREPAARDTSSFVIAAIAARAVDSGPINEAAGASAGPDAPPVPPAVPETPRTMASGPDGSTGELAAPAAWSPSGVAATGAPQDASDDVRTGVDVDPANTRSVPADGEPVAVATVEATGDVVPLDPLQHAVALIDGQLATVLGLISSQRPGGVGHGSATPAATAPAVGQALVALSRAVGRGEIGSRAADTHRSAVLRTADTIERLRSLVDLHARGYLDDADLALRRDALLGSVSPVIAHQGDD